MRRLKITFLLAAVALVAAMLPALSASANVPSTVDDAHTDCVVTGTVTLDGEDETSGTADDGVDTTPEQGHYVFVDTAIDCDGLTAAGIDSTYDVEANGDTDDIQHSGAGEDCSQGGWDEGDFSNDDGSDTPDGETSGDLEATRTAGQNSLLGGLGPANLTGDVQFHRLAEVVYAYGTLDDGSGGAPEFEFSGEFKFEPTQGDCVTAPVTEASLDGVAEIGNA